MISIVVPVFNGASFLEQCLRSLLSQSYEHIEILLINDGSTDSSGAICNDFARQDRRVRAFHKTNGGVSTARNMGMDAAKGDFLMFVDADDYVEPDFVRSMAKQMEHHDIVVCAYDRVRDTSQPFVLGRSAALSLDDLYEHTLCTQLIGGGCCNKIFRMETVRQFSLRFDQRIAVGEDLLFLMQYFELCKSAYYIGDILYHYRFNDESATESGFAQKKVTAATASILTAMGEMERYIDRSVGYQAAALDYRKTRSSLRLFFQMILSGTNSPEILLSIQRNVRESVGVFLRSPHAKMLERVVALGIAVSVRLSYAVAVVLEPALRSRLGAYRT